MAKKKRVRKGPISHKEQKQANQMGNDLTIAAFNKINLMAAYREKIKRMNDGK